MFSAVSNLSFITAPHGNLIILSLPFARGAAEIKAYEKLHENPVLDTSGDNVHGRVCGGQTSWLQKERQELSHEREQGMHLRESVRLQGSSA